MYVHTFMYVLYVCLCLYQSHLHYCSKEITFNNSHSLASDICKLHKALLCHWHKDRRSFPECLRQAELRAHWQMKSTPSGIGLHVHLRTKRMKWGNALTCPTVSAPGAHSKWVSELNDGLREKPCSD